MAIHGDFCELHEADGHEIVTASLALAGQAIRTVQELQREGKLSKNITMGWHVKDMVDGCADDPLDQLGK